MKNNLDHLRIMLSVAEGGSFTAAAAARNTEISVVSRAIRDLEDSVGVLLFERLARGVRLTDAGVSYAASARDILDRVERAGLDARHVNSGRKLHLDLGFIWSVTSKPMVDLLRSFAADAAGLAVAMLEAGNDDLVARVRSGRLDVAITVTDPPPLPRLKNVDGLSTAPLWLEQLVNVLPEDSAMEVATWDDLARTGLLCRAVDDSPRFVRHIERLGGPRLTFETQAVSFEGVLGLVAAGLGSTLLPASLAHLLPKGVRAVPIVSPGAVIQVEAVWRAENSNPALTRFLALCRQLYPATAENAAPSRSPDPLP